MTGQQVLDFLNKALWSDAVQLTVGGKPVRAVEISYSHTLSIIDNPSIRGLSVTYMFRDGTKDTVQII